jgi:hypothetical protein
VLLALFKRSTSKGREQGQDQFPFQNQLALIVELPKTCFKRFSVDLSIKKAFEPSLCQWSEARSGGVSAHPH